MRYLAFNNIYKYTYLFLQLSISIFFLTNLQSSIFISKIRVLVVVGFYKFMKLFCGILIEWDFTQLYYSDTNDLTDDFKIN